MQENVPIYGNWVASLDGYVNANIPPQVTGYLIKQDYREGSLVRKATYYSKLIRVPCKPH